jgi:polyisoprenyl-phosphate glycosyltransferase
MERGGTNNVSDGVRVILYNIPIVEDNKLISIIVPVYNEEEVVVQFYARLKENLKDNYEIIFIDDGSADQTLNLIKDIANNDQKVKILSFSRNFGHQFAITAGIDHCEGDAAIIIDADLQDPPEVIPEMIKKWKDGYNVVFAVRKKRKGENFFKRATASVFYRLIKHISNIEIPLDTGDFRLIDKKVIETLKKMPEKSRFMRGLVSWVGFKQVALEYEREKRFAGKTKYPMRKMVNFALEGITSFSFFPLRLISLLGMMISFLTFVFILVVLWLRLFTSWTITGWTSLMLAILFLGGIQIIAIGILGEYLAKVFGEVKNRPHYILNEKINL